MEKIKVVSSFSVSIPGWKGPLPVNSVYGQIDKDIYIFYVTYDEEDNERRHFFTKKYGPGEFHGARLRDYPAIRKLIMNTPMTAAVFCNHHAKKHTREFFRGLDEARREEAQARRDWQEIAPVMRRVCYTYTPSSTASNSLRKLNLKPDNDYRRGFDYGQLSGGPEAFLTKRDGLKVLDKTHGKTEGKEKFKVALPEHSVPKRARTEAELREEAAKLMTERSASFRALGWKE